MDILHVDQHCNVEGAKVDGPEGMAPATDRDDGKNKLSSPRFGEETGARGGWSGFVGQRVLIGGSTGYPSRIYLAVGGAYFSLFV